MPGVGTKIGMFSPWRYWNSIRLDRMMKKTTSEEGLMYTVIYKNDFFGAGSTVCKIVVLRNQHLEAIQEPQPALIVFLGERPDNPGKSVTNAIKALAQTVYEGIGKPAGIKPCEICWVECYPESRPITMDIVTFKHDREIGAAEKWEDPKWKNVAPDHPFLRGF
jgi:hypothetical protein